MSLLLNRERRKGIVSATAFAAKLAASVALAASALVPLAGSMAQTLERSFHIPAQPLASALNAFGRQSGLQVTLAATTSQGIRSPAVSGTLSADAALAKLLDGTGISYRIADGTAVIGRYREEAAQAADEQALLPIVLTAPLAGKGDVAERFIGPEQLERIDPLTMADVFRDEAAIRVGSAIAMSQKIYVHGIEETNLAVSIDGARQNNKVFHHAATNLIDPSILRAVDVDAGIAPADAGPGALAGAIDYQTRKASDLLEDGRSFAGVVTSTWNFNSRTAITGLTAYGSKDGFDVLGAFTFGKGGAFSDGDGKRVEGTATDLLSGLGKIGYELGSGDRIEISHDRVVDDAPRPYRANSGFIATARSWEPVIRDYRLDRQNTVFTYTDATPEGWWDPKLLLAYGATDVTIPIYGPAGRLHDDTGETSSFNGKFENRFSFDSGSVVAGIDFYRDAAKLDDPFEGGSERAVNVGLYAQSRLEPWERTRLSFGGRLDRQRFTGVDGRDFGKSGISTNLSGEYDLTDSVTAKAGVSRVWAGVPLAENFIINPAWDYGDNGPKSVTATNGMIGLKAGYGGLTVEASLFRTDLNDARVAAHSQSAGGALRSHDVRSRGFEIGAGYQWTGSFVKAGYVHVDADIDGLPANSDSGNYLASPVGDIVTISAGHTFDSVNLTVGGDIEIAPEYRHVTESGDRGRIPYPAYKVVNLFAEWKPERHQTLALRAEVRNLFDETYSQRATYGQEFGNVTPLREPGRTVLIAARASF